MMTRNRSIVQPDWAGTMIESDIEGWPVIEKFEPVEEKYETGMTDLSHRPKAIMYGPALENFKNIAPGKSVWTGQGFLSPVKPGEAVLFDLTGPKMEFSLPKEATDMTDAWVLLSIWGPKAIEVLQRLFPVDLDRPEIKNPFYFVTQWHALVVQILNLKGFEPGFLLATDRSQGQNLFDGLFSAGRYVGLKPVGLRSWEQWFKRRGFPPRS